MDWLAVIATIVVGIAQLGATAMTTLAECLLTMGPCARLTGFTLQPPGQLIEINARQTLDLGQFVPGDDRRCSLAGCCPGNHLKGEIMPKAIKMLATASLLAAATTASAMAQGYYYSCPPGYTLVGGTCRVVGAAGAIAGGAVGAAGAIAGGALNATGNIVGGTVGAVTGSPPPRCGYGYVYYNGGCYPAR